ncbi:hypothetical protein ACHQM5_020007 [Ranunculus cassubicifolius]
MEKEIHNLSKNLKNSLTIPSMVTNIPTAMLQSHHSRWNMAIIFTLLHGDNLDPNQVMRNVRLRWHLQRRMDMIRVANNRFVCRFDRIQDRDRIEEDQPWMILDRLVLLQPYTNEICPETVEFNSIPFWIGFRGLMLEHINPEVVSLIASSAGTFLAIRPDGYIPRSTEGYRVRIEVDVK